MSFVADLAAARTAYFTSENRGKLPEADFAAMAEARDPKGFALMMAKIWEIRATLPELKASYDALAARACHRCNGTGEYSGATSRLRRGQAYCFACNGAGHRD